MNIVALAATVVLVVQVIKNILLKFRVVVQKWGAILLAILVSLVTVAIEAVLQSVPFDAALLWILLQVAFYAVTGKFLLNQTVEKFKNEKKTIWPSGTPLAK